MNGNFKELKEFSKELQVKNYVKAYSAKDLPRNMKPEIAFIGKSNVGKSSLINTLLNHNINRTSQNPGCTRWIGFIELPKINLIDLPGYGFAKVSQGRQNFWEKMINGYIQANRLNKLFILVDSRKGIQAGDSAVADIFNVPHQFLLTKADQKGAYNNPSDFLISTVSGVGIHELRKLILELEEV
jgi:GTP-binding protein